MRGWSRGCGPSARACACARSRASWTGSPAWSSPARSPSRRPRGRAATGRLAGGQHSLAARRSSPRLRSPWTMLPRSSSQRSVTTIGLGTNSPSTRSAGTMLVNRPRRRALWALQVSHSVQLSIARSMPYEQRQEVGAAAVGRRAVPGAGLSEQRQVLGDREVAGHADLLPAGDAHAVDAADHRLVAVQDRGDHVVEQPHVLAVLLRPARVVLGVLSGVAAGAERAAAGAGEHHRDAARSFDAARIARITPFTISVV